MAFCVNFSRFVHPPEHISHPGASHPRGQKKQAPSPKPPPVEVFEKCICSGEVKEPDLKFLHSKKWKNEKVDLEIIPSKEFGNKIRNFMRCWDTEGLSETQLKHETLLWKHFFLEYRDNSIGINLMDFQRSNPEVRYGVKIFGDNIEKLAETCEEEFEDHEFKTKFTKLPQSDQEAELLVQKIDEFFESRKMNLRAGKIFPRDNVFVSVSNSFAGQKNDFTVLTSLKFRPFIEMYNSTFRFNMMNPLVPLYFSTATSISRMRYVLNYGGIGVIHDYNSLDPASANGKI